MRATFILLGLLSALGCGEKGEAKSPAARKEAAAGAFCQEHGVPEAACTKCNPALISVFKQKGDWCEEHGFPESICPVCHPDRGGRPAADVSADGAPADGTRVRLGTKETARLAGLRVVRAAEQPNAAVVTAPARIVYDATKVAFVNALSPGVVRAVKADLGARVREGAPLAVIESAGVGADRSQVQAAAARLEVAEANHARARRLFDERIVPERDLLAARQELEAARAQLGAARAALGVVGAGVDGAGRYTLVAPIGGVVVRREVAIGKLVSTEEVLFHVADTSAMWAEIDLPESDVPSAAAGQRAIVIVDALGQREFAGTLTYVAPEIDPRTRTVLARMPLDNRDGVLRANMFGEARVEVTRPLPAVLVPRAAVQRARGATLVFVRLAEDLYEARRVDLGAAIGDRVEIVRGIRAGEEVVTDGSFLLKTETLKESIGAGCVGD